MIDMIGVEMSKILETYNKAVDRAEENLGRSISRAAIIYGSTLVSCQQIFEVSVANAMKELKLATAQAREKYDEEEKYEAKENRSEDYQGSRGKGDR